MPEPDPNNNAHRTQPGRPTDETADSVELSLPGYSLLGVLGKGACGVVYRARQHALDRVVALKTIAVEKTASVTVLARFEKESVSLARLTHPNIVQVYDAGRRGDQVYFAMELLAGEDLDARIARDGPLAERAAWLVARQAAAALAHAAAQGIFHRDVKPANLYLVPPPTGFGLPAGVPMVKVTDFGLALNRTTGSESAQRLTQAGVTLGTPVYMAPEQFSTPDVNHRADIYALGATVYEALAGKPAFAGRTVWDVMRKKADPAPRLGPPVSPEGADLVADMLEADLDRRIDSYEELIARIDALPVVAGAAVASCPVPAAGGRSPAVSGTPHMSAGMTSVTLGVAKAGTGITAVPARRWAWAAGAAVLLVAALLVVGWAIRHRGQGRSQGAGDPSSAPRPSAKEPAAPNPPFYLFGGDRRVVTNWERLAGGGWNTEKDTDDVVVLTGDGRVRRPFSAALACRLTVHLDLHKAKAVELAIAPSKTPWVLRITRESGATLGLRTGDAGLFEPAGKSVAFPPVNPEDQSPYLEVQAERTGGKWVISFHGEKVNEAAGGDGSQLELWITTEGGPIRIESAMVEDVPPKS